MFLIVCRSGFAGNRNTFFASEKQWQETANWTFPSSSNGPTMKGGFHGTRALAQSIMGYNGITRWNLNGLRQKIDKSGPFS